MSRVFFAVDISGSTNGGTTYWKHVGDILEENKSRINDYLLWNHEVTVVSYGKVMEHIKYKIGNGMTRPQNIPKYLKDGDELILITDGQVISHDVNEATALMSKKKLKSCDAHIIDNDPDMSVVCAFTRGVKSTTKTHWFKTETICNLTEDDFKVIDNLEGVTLSEFIEKYETIRLVLLNKMIGVNNLDKSFHDRLVAMKSRLYADFIRTNADSCNIHDNLTSGDYEGAKRASKEMIERYYGNSPIKEFSAKFDTLINIVAGKTNFSINQFNPIVNNVFTTSKTIDQSDTELLLDVECNSVMECPVMMDDDVPVIPILHGEPILYGIDKKIIDNVIKNPLSILGYKEIVDKIKTRLSQPIGLFAYCEIVKNSDSSSFRHHDLNRALHPLTRIPMTGAIPLGTNSTYVNETNKAIMHMFTGGKVIGNIDLYYAVIYFITKDISYLSDSVKFIVEQLKHRMNYHKTSASLSGISDYVGTKILMKEAIWFVLTSGNLYTDNAVIPIRQHAFVYKELLELNEMNGYRISDDDLDYVKKTKQMLSMLHQSKKDPYFKDKIRSLYQMCIIVKSRYPDETKYIFLDRPAYNSETNTYMRPISLTKHDIDLYEMDEVDETEEMTLYNRKLTYAISTIVNPLRSAVNIDIKSIPDIDTIEFPVISDIWKLNGVHCNLKISPNTCRPLYNIGNGETWVDSWNKHYAGGKVLSLNKYVGSYVVDNLRFPNKFDLMLYAWKRETGKGETTLDVNILDHCENIISQYSEVFNTLTPEEFSKRFQASVKRDDRVKME